MWTGRWRAAGQALEIIVDREKAIRAGITAEQIVRTFRVALAGADAGLVHVPTSREPVPIVLRLDRAQRAHLEDLLQLSVHGTTGGMVPLSEVVTEVRGTRENASATTRTCSP